MQIVVTRKIRIQEKFDPIIEYRSQYLFMQYI